VALQYFLVEMLGEAVQLQFALIDQLLLAGVNSMRLNTAQCKSYPAVNVEMSPQAARCIVSGYICRELAWGVRE
jgi:hypothetical protein